MDTIRIEQFDLEYSELRMVKYGPECGQIQIGIYGLLGGWAWRRWRRLLNAFGLKLDTTSCDVLDARIVLGNIDRLTGTLLERVKHEQEPIIFEIDELRSKPVDNNKYEFVLVAEDCDLRCVCDTISVVIDRQEAMTLHSADVYGTIGKWRSGKELRGLLEDIAAMHRNKRSR